MDIGRESVNVLPHRSNLFGSETSHVNDNYIEPLLMKYMVAGPQLGWSVHEAFGVGGVRSVESNGALLADLVAGAVVDRCWRVVANARVSMFMVVPAEELDAERSSSIDPSEHFRKLGPVFMVRNWASEKALSFGVLGRVTDLVISKSANSYATGFAAGTPRSEWTVSFVGSRS